MSVTFLRQRTGAGRGLVAVGFSLIFLFFLTVSVASAVSVNSMISIDRDEVNLRSGPGKKYKVQWVLSRGYPLRVVGVQGNWYKVKDFEDDYGWVYKKMVSRKPHLVVKVNKGGKAIKIHSGPGEKYKVVGQAQYGVVFRTLERKAGWVKVRHESGLSGWMVRSQLWGW